MLNVPELGKPWIQTVDIIYPHIYRKKDKSSPQQNTAGVVGAYVGRVSGAGDGGGGGWRVALSSLPPAVHTPYPRL